jgi:hypothetical protein
LIIMSSRAGERRAGRRSVSESVLKMPKEARQIKGFRRIATISASFCAQKIAIETEPKRCRTRLVPLPITTFFAIRLV